MTQDGRFECVRTLDDRGREIGFSAYEPLGGSWYTFVDGSSDPIKTTGIEQAKAILASHGATLFLFGSLPATRSEVRKLTLRGMLRNHSVRLSVFGITCLIHWSLVLMVIWVALIELAAIMLRTGNGGSSLPVILGLVLSVIAHEMAHAVAAIVVAKKRVEKIVVHPLGGFVKLAEGCEDMRPLEVFVFVMAGPFANAVLSWAFLCAGCMGLPCFDTLAWLNVYYAMLNIAPIFPLDGGRALKAIIQMMAMPRQHLALACATWCVCVPVAVLVARQSYVDSALVVVIGAIGGVAALYEPKLKDVV